MTEDINSKLHKMKLHERFLEKEENGACKTITRVPGGWIYTFVVTLSVENYIKEISSTSVFVPFSREFSEK